MPAEPLAIRGAVLLRPEEAVDERGSIHSGADVAELKVKASYLDKATNLRRFPARAKGRGNVILKQTCHIHVVVGDGKKE